MSELQALRHIIDQPITPHHPDDVATVIDLIRRTCPDAPFILAALGLEAA